MSLIDTMKTPCTLITCDSQADGMGGETTEWVDGAEFDAAIIKDSSIVARIAERQGAQEQYTVTVDKAVKLNFHDVFRRNSDGAVFRVTSNVTDSQTPDVATFQFGQVTAEKWELPT